MTRPRRRADALGCYLALACCLALAGCGVPTERTPRPIEPSVTIGTFEGPIGAGGPVASPGSAAERLFLVRENQLVAVDRPLNAAPLLERHLHDLVSGPTEQERDNGLDSALGGTDLIAGVTLRNGTAVVGLDEDNLIRNDEILAYGQIVCTLAARDDVDSVQFTQNGRPLEVPRADGSLTPDPLTAADYRALIA
jgi:hypothetical protein